MGAYTNRIVADGTKIYALVELDDYNKTHSTGGIVKKIYWVLPMDDAASAPINHFTPWKNDVIWSKDKYKVIDITNYEYEVFPNYILHDKSNVIKSPNS